MKNILSKLLAAMLTMVLTLAPLSALAEDAATVWEPEVAEATVEEAAEAVDDEAVADDQNILDDQDIAAGEIDAEVAEDEFELSDDEDDGWSTEDFTADAAEVTPAGDQVPVEVSEEESAEEPEKEPTDESAEEPTEEPDKEGTEEPEKEPVEEASVEALEEVAETPAEEAAPVPASEPIVISEDADTSAKLEEAAPAVAAEAAPGIPTQVVKNKAVVYLNKGDAVQLVVAGRTIRSCKSGKRKVASVSKTGLVTARKKGKAKVTVRARNKKKYTVTVKVIKGWGSGTSGKVVVLTQQMLDAMAEAQIRLTNEERAKEGKAPLETDPELMAYAKVRAQELTRKFSHERPDGTSATVGIPGRGVGENIAMDSLFTRPEEAAGVVTILWMNSEGHRNNILSERYGSIGVAVTSLGSAFYWVQVFGPKSRTTSSPIKITITTTTTIPSTTTPTTNPPMYTLDELKALVLKGEKTAEEAFPALFNGITRLDTLYANTPENAEIWALLIEKLKPLVVSGKLDLDNTFPECAMYQEVREEILKLMNPDGESPSDPPAENP